MATLSSAIYDPDDPTSSFGTSGILQMMVHILMGISYAKEYVELMNIFRGLVKAKEYSRRALRLTSLIQFNAANYSVWHFRRLCLDNVGTCLSKELDWVTTCWE